MQMRSPIRPCVTSGLRTVLLTSTFVVLAACQQERAAQPASQDAAMEWARAALERNPQLELVATDSQAQVFTVRDRQSGEVRAVKLDELAAAPVAQLSQRSTPAPAPLPEATASAPAQTAPADPVPQSNQQIEQPAPKEPATAMNEDRPTSSSSDPTANYTIERSAGQVRVTGPGVSIVSAGAGTQGHEGVSHSNSVEPIICEGQRMVHLDGRQIFVDGNAITVRGGCELYITNSRVVATGTGVIVQDGTVHVSNSTIDGQNGSFDVGDEAKLFARSSTFRGIPRRSENALVQDQGGNRWR